MVNKPSILRMKKVCKEKEKIIRDSNTRDRKESKIETENRD